MGTRGPKRKPPSSTMGVGSLQSRDVVIDGHRTSMRMEPSMWDALDEIAQCERWSVHDLCNEIRRRLVQQAERNGTAFNPLVTTQTKAVRSFIVSYFRRAGTDGGRHMAPQGESDPFRGTPLELPADDVARPSKGKRPNSGGIGPLQSRNIVIDGHRTSMRFEPSMWEALEEIAQRERMSIHDLCSEIRRRLVQQAEQNGTEFDPSSITQTTAVRTFIISYFRRAGTDGGRHMAPQGEGDPFRGTPLDLSADDVARPCDEKRPSSGGYHKPASPPPAKGDKAPRRRKSKAAAEPVPAPVLALGADDARRPAGEGNASAPPPETPLSVGLPSESDITVRDVVEEAVSDLAGSALSTVVDATVSLVSAVIDAATGS